MKSIGILGEILLAVGFILALASLIMAVQLETKAADVSFVMNSLDPALYGGSGTDLYQLVSENLIYEWNRLIQGRDLFNVLQIVGLVTAIVGFLTLCANIVLEFVFKTKTEQKIK